MILAKRISDNEKKQIIDEFIKNKTLEEISEKFNFTKLTITRHLKKSLGDEKYAELNKINKRKKRSSNYKDLDNEKLPDSKIDSVSEDCIRQDLLPENMFFEIATLNVDIDNKTQKDFSSVSIKEVDLPKVVYMIVDKQVELETKLLRDYVEWNFLPEEDLKRNTIEIFYDLKTAKRSVKKEQRVIKVPNSYVFNITAPILRARGISRIVSSDQLISL